MMLARQDLVQAWKKKWIRFDPDIAAGQIDLSSIDLRLGFNFTKFKAQQALVLRPAHGLDPTDISENQDFSRESEPLFRLRSKEFILAQTLESVTVPNYLAAHIHGKSSLARAGLAIHATAPHVHPGFVGRITLELFNYGPWELEFVPGKDFVCQLMFWELKTPPSKTVIEALTSYPAQKIPFPKRKEKP